MGMISSLQVNYELNFYIFVMFIGSAKIPERERSNLPPNVNGLVPNY